MGLCCSLLELAERAGRDMTGALVELVSDPETRRIVSHAYAAISPPPVQEMPAFAGPKQYRLSPARP